MRRLEKGKRVVGWALVAAICIGGFYRGTSYAAPLEDSQQTAGTIVTKAKALAKVQAERSKEAQEGKKTNEPVRTLNALLSACSKDTQREFLGSLVLVNGELGSAHVAGIQACLDNARYARVMRLIGADVVLHNNKICTVNGCVTQRGEHCTSNCGKLPCKNNCGNLPGGSDSLLKAQNQSSYASIADLTGGCSEQIRNDFLDSLSFAAGQLEHADVELLAKCSKPTSDSKPLLSPEKGRSQE